MAKATDTRIVQMVFDNKQFERGIKTSEKSLEKFKQYLDFTKCEKGLDSLSKAAENLTFDKAADNLQKLTDKFTGLGTVSELVLSQIRRGIESTASKISGFIDSLSFQQIGAGMEKFNYMNKSVQSIMAATGRSEEDVMKVMQRLNEYTDQTSYDFADMAQNISKFTSVGIKLEDAEKQMEGIANWAARSGAGIQEASRAMYNLSQAMGVGKLLKIDWKSIENAGMATKEFKEQLIQAGLAAGTLVTDKSGVVKTAKSLGKQVEVTYKNLSETLQKGWATSTVVGNTLLQGYYYDDLYYQHGEKAILELSATQKEAFDKMIEADGKLNKAEYKTLENMSVWTKENKQALLDLAVSQKKLTETTDAEGNKQYEAVAKNGKKIQVTIENMEESLTAGWFDKGLYDMATSINNLAKESYEAAQKCKSFTDVIQAWKDQLSTGWMKFWENIFGDLTESMRIFSAICNKVGDSFNNLVRTLSGGYEVLEDGTKVWREGIMGSWAALGGRDSLWSLFIGEYDGMYEGAYGFLDVLKDIGKMISDGFWLLIKSMDPNAANVSDEDWLANETYRTQELGFMLKGAVDKIRNFIQGIKDFFTEVPQGASKSRFQMVQDVVLGVLSIAKIAYSVIRDIIGFIEVLLDQNHLGPAVDGIIEIFSMLGRELTKAGNEAYEGKGLKYFLDQLLGVLGDKDTGLIHSFNELIGFIKKLVGWLIGANNEESRTIQLWKVLADYFIRKAKRIAMVLNHIIFPIIGFFEDLLEAGKALAKGDIDFTGFVERVKEGIKKAINSIFSFTPDFTGKVKQIFQDIKEVFTSGFSKKSVDKLSGHLSEMWNDLKAKVPQSVKNALKAIYNGVSGFIRNAIEKIKEFFRPFWQDVRAVFTSGFSKDSLTNLKNRFQTIFKGISDAIPQGLKDGFNNALKKVGGIVGKIWEKIQNKITGILSGNGDKEEGLGATVKRYIRAYTNPKEFGMGGDSKKGNSIFDKIIALLKAGFEKVKEYVTKVIGNISSFGPVKKIREFADQILHPGGFEQKKTIFDRISSAIHSGMEKIKSLFVADEGSLWYKMKQFFSKIDLSSLALLIVGGLGVVGLIKLISKATKAFNSILTITENISKIPKSLGDIINGPTVKEQAGDKFLKIAAAIGIIIFALYKIGMMPFWSAVQGFVIIALVVGGMIVTMNLIKKSMSTMSAKQLKQFEAALVGMIEIAIAIWIVGKALERLGKMDWAQWGRALMAFAVIIGGFWAVSTMLKKGGSFKKDQLAGLMVFAGSLILLSLSIAILGKLPFAQLAQGVIAVGVIMVLLVGIAQFIQSETKGVGFANSGVKELGFLAMGVALLAFSIVPLALLPFPKLIQGIAGVAGLVLALYMIVHLMNRENQERMSMKDSGMAQLIAVAGAVMMLVLAVVALALLPADRMLRGILGVVGLILALGILVVAVNQMTVNGGGLKGTAMAQLIAVAGAIMMLVLAVIPLALLKPQQFEQGIKGVIWLVTALMAFTVIVNYFSGGNKLSGMVGLLAVAGAVMMLVLAMIPLALLKPEQFVQALVGVVAIIMSFALLIGLVNKYGADVKPAALVALLAVAGAVLLLVLALIPLALADPLGVAVAFAGIVVLMLVMSLVIKQMGKMKTDAKKAAASAIMLVTFAAVIYVMAIAIRSIKDVKWEVIAAFAVGLSVLLLAMAAAIKIISTIQNPAAMISAMLVLVAGIALIMGAIALLAPIMMDALGGAIERMMARLALVAGMFGDFVNGMNDVSESDMDAAKRKFDKLLDIVKSMAGVNAYYADIQSFADCMLLLGSGMNQFVFSTQSITDVENLGGIKMVEKFLSLKTQFAGFTIGQMASDIFSLGVALSLFNASTSGITVAEPPSLAMLKSLSADADNLKKLSEVPFDQLKSSLAGIGGALSIYAEGAAEANAAESGKSTDMTKAVEIMRSITESFSGENGKFEIPDIPKESDLAGFGADLAALATAIKRFANASAGMTNTQKAKDVLTFMKNLQTDLRAEQLEFVTAFQDAGITDIQTLTDFGLQISALGEALKKYDETTKDFKGNENAKKALEFFRNLKSDLTKDDLEEIRVFDELGTGKQATDVLTRFGTDIGALGEALSKFAANVNFNDDVETDFNNAIKALDGFVEMSRRLPKIGGVIGFWEGNTQTLGQLGTDLETVGIALRNMSNALQGNDTFKAFDYELVSNALGALENVNLIANALAATKGIEGAYDGYRDLTDLAVFISRFTNADYWKNTDESMMGNIENGKTIIDYFVDMMVALRTASEKVGGFENTKPFEAFRNMAEGVVALVNADPTLDFSKVGEHITDGVGLGILKKQEDLCTTLTDVLRGAIAQMMEESPDINPVITPVLDLSNVRRGMSTVGGIFQKPYGLNFGGSMPVLDVSGASFTANQAIPKDYSDELTKVKNTVSGMRTDLQTLAEAMRQTKFVFQSGQVVAAIGPEMDRYLAEHGFWASRSEIP